MHLTVASVDSALGRWTHHACDPPHLPPALAGAVLGLWHFEGRVALLRERTFPGGYLELIVHLGPRFRPVDAGVAGVPFPVACVTGVQTGPLVVEAPDATCRVLGIRLRPLGAYALLAAPLDATAGHTLDLADVSRTAADELAGRCHEARTVDECFARAAAWLTRRLHGAGNGRGAAHPAVAWAAGQLEAHGGVVSVTRLREQSGLGRTRFAAAFRAQVGMGAKRYASVLRFRRALGLLQGGARPSDAALAAGYYDQAHLNAGFREFAGMTPAAFTAAARYANSPSLAEPA